MCFCNLNISTYLIFLFKISKFLAKHKIYTSKNIKYTPHQTTIRKWSHPASTYIYTILTAKLPLHPRQNITNKCQSSSRPSLRTWHNMFLAKVSKPHLITHFNVKPHFSDIQAWDIKKNYSTLIYHKLPFNIKKHINMWWGPVYIWEVAQLTLQNDKRKIRHKS